MGIFKKFNDLVRSNVNDWLDKAEDPEKMLAQRLLDLEEGKQKVHKLLIRAMASLKLAEQKERSLKTQVAKAEDQSEEFHRINNRYQELKQLIEQEQHAISALKQGLKKLEYSLVSLKNQPRTASVALLDNSLFDEMARMEEKILHNEALIEAQGELEKDLNSPKKTESTDAPSLSDEIEKLKAKIKNDE